MLDARPILALDCGTNMGWAMTTERGVVSGVHRLRRDDEPGVYGATYAALADWLADMITTAQPAAVFFEAPIPRGDHAGMSAARMMLGFAAIVELVCYRRDIKCRETHIQTVRKHFCGSGIAKKDEVMAECRRRGWEPVDHNAADALAVLDFAVLCERPRQHAATTPLFAEGRA